MPSPLWPIPHEDTCHRGGRLCPFQLAAASRRLPVVTTRKEVDHAGCPPPSFCSALLAADAEAPARGALCLLRSVPWRDTLRLRPSLCATGCPQRRAGADVAGNSQAPRPRPRQAWVLAVLSVLAAVVASCCGSDVTPGGR